MRMNGPLSILYVDDDPLEHEMFRNQVSMSGENVEIISALSVKEGIKVALEKAIDFVILDLNLGITKGSETVRDWISQCSVDIPLIALTGDQSLCEEAKLSGCSDCYNKSDPFSVLLTGIMAEYRFFNGKKNVNDLFVDLKNTFIESRSA